MKRAAAQSKDRGSATVELMLAVVLFGLLLMAAVQFALWQHASHMARASANQGLQTARAYGSSATTGQADTTQLLSSLGGNVLHDTTVTVTRSQTTATVTVRGHATGVFPWLSVPVVVTVTAPVERVP